MKQSYLRSAAALSALTLASPALAAITVLHSWSMGDAEAGTADNPAAETIIDTVGGVNVTRTGAPTYAALGGGIGVDFNNVGSAHNVAATEYYSSIAGDVNPSDPARWGVEAIVRIDLLPANNQELAVIELGASSGGILLQTFGNGAWGLHRSGVAITSDPNPVLVGQTQHLAAVLNEGAWQLWVDGTLAASFPDAGYNPVAGIRIGAGNAGAGINRGFNGVIDTVRVFEYTGTFDIDQTLVPEPASLSLLGLGALMMLRRRR